MKHAAILLLALAVACGDDDSTGADAAADAASDTSTQPDARMADAGADTDPVDADPADTAPADADPADADPADADPTDAGVDAMTPDMGDPMTPGAMFLRAVMNSTTADCACFFEDEGYESAAQCGAVGAPSSATLPCIEAAATASGFADEFPCIVTACEEGTACFAAAGCDDEDAADACELELEGAFEACGNEDALDAWFDLGLGLAECTTGAEATCPTGDPSSATGASVFTGVSVGLGNQFTDEECHSEGAQATHVWTAPAAGSYVFDTVGSDFDTMLALYADCDATESLDCNDDGVADTLFSSVEREMTEASRSSWWSRASTARPATTS